MQQFKRKFATASAAFLYMGLSTSAAFADDTEIYIGLTPTADKRTNPNVLLVLDTSGSMSSGVTGTTCTSGSTIADLCDGKNLSRLGVVKQVTAQLVNELKADGKVNFGLMRFDLQAEGGMITYPTAPVAGAATEIINRLNKYRANGNTPLSETLYEAARYYRGNSVYYGLTSATKDTAGSNPPTVWTPSVRESYSGNNIVQKSNLSTAVASNNAKYISPIETSCQKNHIIYLTDGAPTGDTGAASLIRSLTGKSCGNSNGECMDELSEYLFNEDQSSVLDGKQTVTTHTIGFFEDSPLLESTATRGGGKYYTADDVSGLVKALRTIINEILAQNATFTTPTVSVSAYNNLGYRNELYYALFRPAQGTRWPGNVKRYKLGKDTNGEAQIQDFNGSAAITYSGSNAGFFKDTALSWWSPSVDGADVSKGGFASKLTSPSTRKLYTYTGADLPPNSTPVLVSNYPLNKSNTAITNSLLGKASMTATERAKILDWSRGNLLDNTGNSIGNNLYVGDVLHNEPKLVSYEVDNSGTTATEKLYMFFGSNQGFLHALDPETGTEKFAFMPKELLPNLKAYYDDEQGLGSKRYGLDGHLAVWVEYADAVNDVRRANKVNLYAGMRRGGSNYYALDVLDIDAPKLKWVIKGIKDSDGNGIADDFDSNGVADSPATTGFERLGQTWSAPKLAKVNWNGSVRTVLFFSGGYDTNQDSGDGMTNLPSADRTTPLVTRADKYGNSLYMVDAETGQLLWRAGHTSETGANVKIQAMVNSIPASPALIDITGDALVDTIFAADTRGQIFRFDINQSNTGANTFANNSGRIARLGDDYTVTSDDNASSNRRFYYTPDVSLIRERGGDTYYTIALGSGWREHPLNETTQDRFYVLRDKNVLTAPSYANGDLTGGVITEAGMVDATGVNISDSDYASIKSQIDSKLGLIDQYNNAVNTAEANYEQYKTDIGYTNLKEQLLMQNAQIDTLSGELDILGKSISTLEAQQSRLQNAVTHQEGILANQEALNSITEQLNELNNQGTVRSEDIAAVQAAIDQTSELYNQQLSIQSYISTQETAISDKEQAIAVAEANAQSTTSLKNELTALKNALYGALDDPDTVDNEATSPHPSITMRTALETNSGFSTQLTAIKDASADILDAVKAGQPAPIIDSLLSDLSQAQSALASDLGAVGISSIPGSTVQTVDELLARNEANTLTQLNASLASTNTTLSSLETDLSSRQATQDTLISERDVTQNNMSALEATAYNDASNVLTAAQKPSADLNSDGTLTMFEAYEYLLLQARTTAQAQIPTLRTEINALYAQLSPGNSYTVNTSLLTNSAGWFIRLAPGEKVLSGSVTLQGALFFNTFLPTGQSNGCAPDVGTSRFYATNIIDGSAVYQQTINGNVEPIRSIDLARPGIAPTPAVVPTSDGVVVISGTEVNPFENCEEAGTCTVPPECRKDIPFCIPGNNVQPTYWREQ